MESRRHRCRDRHGGAPGSGAAEEGSGCLDLSHRLDDEGPDHPVPQRHLRSGRRASGGDRGRSGVLQPGRQSSVDGASRAVNDGPPTNKKNSGGNMMILHHGWRSSASRRVRLCLEEKGLSYEAHVVDMAALEHHSPEYLKINPLGVIPTLIHDGQPLHESGTICEYLDETYPDPRLRPETPYERAVMRNWIRHIDGLIGNLIIFN